MSSEAPHAALPAPLRPPHAGEPIRSSIEAIAVVSLAIHRPLEAETIAFFLDETGRSNTITVVSGTTEPDSVSDRRRVHGARRIADCPTLCGVVLASVRPDAAPNMPATLPGDIDRWLEANEITEASRHRAGRVVRRRARRRRLPTRSCSVSQSAGESARRCRYPCGRGARSGSTADPRTAKPAQQLPARRQQRAGSDQVVEVLLGHVVVVALEPARAGSLPARRTSCSSS